MKLENKRKTQLEIDLIIWAEVKRFATLKELSINEATQLLLEKGLTDCGFNVRRETMVSGGGSPANAVVDIQK